MVWLCQQYVFVHYQTPFDDHNYHTQGVVCAIIIVNIHNKEQIES